MSMSKGWLTFIKRNSKGVVKTKNKMREEIGKYLLDVSKLVFGGVVLGSIFQIEEMSKFVVLTIGVLVTLFLAIWGFILLRK